MDRCNGEIESVGIRKIDDPIGSGMEYSSHCLTCARWAGHASESAADMQDFVSVRFLGEIEDRRFCTNWLSKENACAA